VRLDLCLTATAVDGRIALSSKLTDPGYNYWYFLGDDYALGIKATQ
jgi:hypothetical protein